ncbi:MAG: hypothetical protein HOE90_25100 [Bacteriovoracaceae bacterium]|jgi:hypothetical protein|nr:hypothetical protein [Bacteriovoracaceae bacterium]
MKLLVVVFAMSFMSSAFAVKCFDGACNAGFNECFDSGVAGLDSGLSASGYLKEQKKMIKACQKIKRSCVKDKIKNCVLPKADCIKEAKKSYKSDWKAYKVATKGTCNALKDEEGKGTDASKACWKGKKSVKKELKKDMKEAVKECKKGTASEE